MYSFFRELGLNVLAAWQAQNFSPARFPEIAQQALEQKPPSDHVAVAELIRHFLIEDEQPFQTSSGFGQPELVVFDHPRFYIQVLFWLDGTTDIHQHAFSGAFHVMEGSSIQSRFRFENGQPVTSHLQVGDLRMTETRLLERGCTVPIVSGPSHIHALFHLDAPSLTVVVRTHNDAGTGPQFTYLPPHIALDPLHHDALTMRRKQLLDVLEQTGDSSYTSLVKEMLQALDFERGFFILQNGMACLRAREDWEEVWELFASRHESLAAFVPPTLDEILRRDRLVEMRRSIAEVEHRFFLALLLNVPDRNELLRLVSERHPGPPLETVLSWLAELCDPSPLGTLLLDAEFPSDLEIPPDEQPEILLAALSILLEAGPGRAAQAAGLPPLVLERLRETLAASSLRPLFDVHSAQ